MKIPKIFPENKTTLYVIQNGVGKCVLFSNLIEDLHKIHNSKISICSTYPELFKNHPLVASSIGLALPHYTVLQDYFTDIIYFEPYKSNYLFEQEHILTSWRKGLNLDSENYKDIVDVYTDDKAKIFYEQVTKKIGKKYIIIQLKGGNNIHGEDRQDIMIFRNYREEYPLIKAIHDSFPDYFIMCIKVKNDKYDTRMDQLDRMCTVEDEPLLTIQELVNNCSAFVSIDSCVQHMACNKISPTPGVVLWSTITNPLQIGHTLHHNLQSDIVEFVQTDPIKVTNCLKDILNGKNQPIHSKAQYQRK